MSVRKAALRRFFLPNLLPELSFFILGSHFLHISYKTLQIKAHDLLTQEKYEDCIEACKQCQAKIIRSLGAQSPELIYVKLILCEVYTELGRFADAMTTIQQVGQFLDHCPGLTDAHIYRVYYYRDLGTLHRIQLRLAEAQFCFQKVAEVRGKYQGYKHPDTALSLVDLALVHKVRNSSIFCPDTFPLLYICSSRENMTERFNCSSLH
jgi:tetratricopeptide (TPR) repeat protein